MLKRKIYDELLSWKKNKKEECLLIKGARQVGKTFIINKFGKDNYKNFFEINFIFYPEMKTIFSGSLEVDEIIMRLSLHFPNASFIAGETLIFFDEIQVCPQARTALKSFAIDKRFDVIASGSLLGLHYGQDPEIEEEITSIPVGYEREMVMYSLDYEEFLWAKGFKDEQIQYIKGFFEREEIIPHEINERMQDLFRQYMVVGGMPSVVTKFIDTNNMSEVHIEQERILSSYLDDIGRHAKCVEKQKVRKCWLSIPKQLAKENKKFQYTKVEHGGNARKFSGSIQWLVDASIANMCTNVSVPHFPLSAYEDESYFKLYTTDTGLLIAMYGYDMKLAILNKTLTHDVKLGIYENIIAEMLIKKGYKLHYYKPVENDQEIEFLISKQGKIYPIEVKAKNGSTISLNRYIDKFHPEKTYKFIDGNIGKENERLTLPHYMAMFLDTDINQ